MVTLGKRKKATRQVFHSFESGPRGAKTYSELMRHYRSKFAMAQPLVVRLTGFSPRSVAKWIQGESPSPKQEETLVEIDRLLEGLARVMENNADPGSAHGQTVDKLMIFCRFLPW